MFEGRGRADGHGRVERLGFCQCGNNLPWREGYISVYLLVHILFFHKILYLGFAIQSLIIARFACLLMGFFKWNLFYFIHWIQAFLVLFIFVWTFGIKIKEMKGSWLLFYQVDEKSWIQLAKMNIILIFHFLNSIFSSDCWMLLINTC